MKYFVHCVNALSHFLLLAVFGIKYKVNLLFSLLVHQMASTECHQDERRCFTAFFFFFFLELFARIPVSSSWLRSVRVT